ncbi:hypothetical protein [Wohlfahrtiimonas larvae]|uniref:Uncharacterized protein n=1 Tax=Wohlfahrtiimonas larvae TaxID=1157986 RepID=A0ABP9MT37_9GAMM|nr:hypothetical protein [Wohlfahrtiimonas larvae]
MKKKNVQKSLKGLGACYEIDHKAICRALGEESPELLKVYGEENPVGSFVFFSDSGIRFIPSPNNSGVLFKMAQPLFQEQLTQMLEIILRKIPEYLMAEGIERQSYDQNMASLRELYLALLIDIEALRGNTAPTLDVESHFATQAIKEAASFVGVLSDEYGITKQAIAYSDHNAIKLELVSREEVGLTTTNTDLPFNPGETVH